MAVQPTASKAAASQPPIFFFIIAPFSVILRRSLSKKRHSSWRAVVLCRPTGQSYQKGRERSRQAAQFIQEKFGYSAAALISKIAALFHRDALGKVPGLINVAAIPQKHRFCGNPVILLKSPEMNSVDFKILRRKRKILVRRSGGASARLRSFRKSQRYSTVTLLARFRGLSMSQPRWSAI